MLDGAHFFARLLNSHIPHVAVENPVMHKYAVDIVGRRQDQIVQPWMFGEYETKATGLWLKNLPALVPQYPTKAAARAALGLPEDAKPYARVHLAAPSADRWKLRSTTYAGIAAAMAAQWSRALTGE